jgi:hypothetical protein
MSVRRSAMTWVSAVVRGVIGAALGLVIMVPAASAAAPQPPAQVPFYTYSGNLGQIGDRNRAEGAHRYDRQPGCGPDAAAGHQVAVLNDRPVAGRGTHPTPPSTTVAISRAE